MKVIKIGAIWCSACLIMNKRWKEVKEEVPFESVELDYDMDEEEVQKYHPGDILPIFIFEKEGKEISRLEGEVTKEELLKQIKEG